MALAVSRIVVALRWSVATRARNSSEGTVPCVSDDYMGGDMHTELRLHGIFIGYERRSRGMVQQQVTAQGGRASSLRGLYSRLSLPRKNVLSRERQTKG
jgi:hypothetical protein